MDTGAVINPSILSNWKPDIQIPNVIGALQGGAQLQAQRLANQKLLAQRAVGQDYQASINPLTGQPSLQGFGQRLAKDPTAAFDAQAGMQNTLANATQALHLHLQKTQAAADIAGDAYAQMVKDPANAHKIGRTAIVDGMNAGLYGPQEATSQIAQLPSNPQDLLQNFGQAAGQLQSVASNLKDFVGSPSVINTGSQQIMGRINPLTGAFVPANAVQNQLSPSAQIQPVAIPGQGGTTVMPGAVAAAMLHGGPQPLMGGAPQPPLAGGYPNGAGGIPQADVGPGYMPRPTAPVASAPLPQPTSQPPAPSTPLASIPYPSWTRVNPMAANVINPSVTEYQQTSTQLYNKDVADVSNINQKTNFLQQIVAEGANANPGDLAPAMEKFGSALHQLGLVTGQQATNLDLLNKDAANLVAQAGQSLGVPTDGKMATIMEANPNSKMTMPAIQTAAAQLRGMYEYKNAELTAFHQWAQAGQARGLSVGPSAYAAFNKQFQSKVPVAVFQINMLPPAQRTEYLKSLSVDDKKKLLAGFEFAASTGLIQAPGK
jgi:hypothetical protein